eukprot:8081852-Karenia_brevis.AAC.1
MARRQPRLTLENLETRAAEAAAQAAHDMLKDNLRGQFGSDTFQISCECTAVLSYFLFALSDKFLHV